MYSKYYANIILNRLFQYPITISQSYLRYCSLTMLQVKDMSCFQSQRRFIQTTTKTNSLDEDSDPLIKYKYQFPKRKPKTTNNVDINELVTQVIQKVHLIDKMITSIPKTTIKKQVEIILNLDANPSIIVEFFSKKPSFLKAEHLGILVEGLKKYGLKEGDIFKLLCTIDNLEELKMKKIETTFDIFRSVGMANNDIIKTFLRNPNIVRLSYKQILNRVDSLKALFKTSDVLSLITSTPDILFDSMDEVTKKFMYVHQNMGVTQRQMMYSSLFQCRLQHVINRHMFLERTGFFTKEIKQNIGRLSTNPILQNIIDNSDADFAKMYGNMDVAEYQAFCKLLAKERAFVSEDEI
ncbi:transcription termination factor 4, mitochondrial [Patella vulgata]|uniref:transcription termination factor 4, mitochondrial n=1 Tax=Patella vulgata TaxID=6465 RepID=UPI0021805F2E|nr:transcription termination factor 4, mitochondrial [Patella vulgata]